MRSPIHKALTFRASSIGDCLMGKYFLDNVHAQYPDARLGILVASRGAMIQDLFAEYPWIEVLEVSRRNPRALWRLWREWRNSDLVVTQYAGKPGGRFSLSSKLAARVLARRGGLIGFTDAFPWNRFLFDHLVACEASIAPAELERRALTAAGIPITSAFPALESHQTADTLTRLHLTAGGYVLAHLFSGSAARGLSPANRKRLVEELARVLPADKALVLTSSPQEHAEAQKAVEGTRAIVLEQTSLEDMMALVAASYSVVAVDTGVAHISAQLGKQLAVLSSCLGIHWWGKDQYGSPATIRVFTQPEPNEHVIKDFPDCINTVDFSAVAHYASA